MNAFNLKVGRKRSQNLDESHLRWGSDNHRCECAKPVERTLKSAVHIRDGCASGRGRNGQSLVASCSTAAAPTDFSLGLFHGSKGEHVSKKGHCKVSICNTLTAV